MKNIFRSLLIFILVLLMVLFTACDVQREPASPSNKDNLTQESDSSSKGNTIIECTHDWKEATCTTPKTCTKCDETRGEETGHSWKKATCTTPKTCTNCLETVGTELGHSWKAATCTVPKTCYECGMTSGSSLEHTYRNGKCEDCGMADSSVVKQYGVGETWVVDGQWEFTVTSVTEHYMCSEYYKEEYGQDCKQVVMINYSYKNIGYVNDSRLQLYFSSARFDVYDGIGEAALCSMYCTHEKSPSSLIPGTFCTASEAYMLSNKGDSISLYVTCYTENGMGKQRAIFVLPITD